MTNSTVQIFGLLLGLASGFCTILAVLLPEWRRNDPGNDILEAIIRHQGLWIRCIAYTTGLWQCDDYDAFFIGLPLKMQVARGLAIVAIAFLCLALILSIFGMECTTCMSNSERTKSRVALIAAVFWILSAMAIGSAVSYFAHEVVQDYSIAESTEILIQDRTFKYVFGSALFLGWAAMALGIVGGSIMLCGSCYVESENEYWNRGPVGKGIQRVRHSFRESYRNIRPKSARQGTDYV